MEQLGAKVERREQSTRVSGSIQLEGLSDLDMNNHPDVALTLIAMSPVIPGTTTISGLSSLHHKECDRLDCPAAEFKVCLLYTSPSPRDKRQWRMPSSA